MAKRAGGIAMPRPLQVYQRGRRRGSCFSRISICRFRNSLNRGKVRAVSPWHHAFVYQTRAHGRDGSGLDAEHGRNVACADLVRVPPSREDISAGAGSNGRSEHGRSWRPIEHAVRCVPIPVYREHQARCPSSGGARRCSRLAATDRYPVICYGWQFPNPDSETKSPVHDKNRGHQTQRSWAIRRPEVRKH